MSVLMIILFAAMLATLVVLTVGILVMARGGEKNAKYSNRLMQLRVFFQGVALAALALLITLE
jgi:hypothetical protein